MKKDAKISLDGLVIEYEPNNGLPKLFAKASQNLNNLQIIKTVTAKASASITGK